jgi:predicted ATPase/DNA-binding CsgD family transcriptional regulator
VLNASYRRERTVDLPSSLTSFIGREREVAAVRERILEPDLRLLTLTGPGGTGKTRLALAAARTLSESFERVHFIPLTTVDDPEQVPHAIARALSIRDAGGTVEQGIVNRLQREPSLLVLDNLEQILGVAPFIASLLARCPELKILATSRVPLRISGEREFPVLPLTMPDSGTSEIDSSEAIALFLDRVRSFDPNFRLTDETRPIVAEICRRLDGLPLAIELAAARTKVLSPKALLSRLGNRLEILTGGPRDAPAHQRTMRDTVAWSYDLLAPDERALLRRIAVFNGEITPESAEAVAAPGDAGCFDLFSSLVEKNLIRRTSDPSGGPHFSMLETIRAFTLEQLDAEGETEEYRLRHAMYFANLAEHASTKLTGDDQASWYRLLDSEYPNLEAALEWLQASGQGELFAKLANALQRYWNIRGHLSEGRHWLEIAIELSKHHDISPSLLSIAHSGAGLLSMNQGEAAAAERHAQAALEIGREVNDQRGTADALMLLGHLAHRGTDYSAAKSYIGGALILYRNIGDKAAIAEAIVRLAQEYMDSGDLDRAAELVVEARDAFRAIGNATGTGSATDNLSIIRYSQHRNEEALQLAIDATETLRAIGSKRGTAVALGHVGKSASRLGDFDASWAAHKEALALRSEIGDGRGLAVWLEAVGYLLAAMGFHAPAAEAIASADSFRASSRNPLFGNELEDRDLVLGTVRSALGQRAFRDAWNAGKDRSLETAIAIAGKTAEAAVSGVALRSAKSEPKTTLPFDLSPREIEVLELVIRRLGDKEIGEALSISPRTVGRHVGNILAKMNARSRHEAADMAREYFPS